jgi:hypothetical protein
MTMRDDPVFAALEDAGAVSDTVAKAVADKWRSGGYDAVDGVSHRDVALIDYISQQMVETSESHAFKSIARAVLSRVAKLLSKLRHSGPWDRCPGCGGGRYVEGASSEADWSPHFHAPNCEAKMLYELCKMAGE